ncbi:hypothetical protein V6M80_13245, partial [Enterococcus faecium]|uniref:hypothetical protein n=1 Tax=Enterococcus faecium TaxID=1352 RepID=UPI002FF2269D
MKLLVVACLSLVGCCYAGLLPGGSAVSAASDFGKAGKDAIQLRNKASDWASDASTATQWANAARDHGRSNSGFDTGASRDAEKNEAANSGFGTVQSNKDLSNSVNNRNAEKASSASAQQNRWADKNDANRFLNDQIWSQGNQWYNGKRNNDNIDYAYDKKFDLRDSENGGYEFALNKNSHALDDYHDKSSAYDRNVDKHAAAVAAADAQSADRKSASTQWSKAADANADKFARNQDSGAWANGRNKDYAQKLDSTQGGDRIWADARKSASDIYNDLSASDSVYDRRNKAFGAKEGVGGVGTNAYGYGIAAPSAYAYKP